MMMAHITDDMLDALRERVRGMMSDKRYAHTCAVEQMAARLGAIYCPEHIPALRAAGLLHDITKEESLENQLQLCEKFDIMVTIEDKLAPKTFHAKTAAARIPLEFAEFADDIVIGAVRWHTTGRAGMTLCEQLVYLADYIDDTRKFTDCVRLRELFWGTDVANMPMEARLAHLRKVLIVSFDMTVQGLLSDGALISRDTIEARNHLLAQTAEN